uniref:Mitochondrial outer membrane transport complex Sam37/metaxin N-terminal domain-containing protein n=1 Tax=Hucho hucho TaxID=62062 RepID=A0A4W5MJC2_9TELE
MAAFLELHCWKVNWGLPSVDTDCLIVLVRNTIYPLEESIGGLSNKYNADYDLSAKKGAGTLAFVSQLEKKLLPASWVDSNYVDMTRRWNAENITFPLNFLLPNLCKIHIVGEDKAECELTQWDSPILYVFGHLAPLLKVKLPNGKLHQHLNSQDNLRHYCTNSLVLYFPSEGGDKFPGVSVHSDGSDFDNDIQHV